MMRYVAAYLLCIAAPAMAAEQFDPVVCDPDQVPVITELRTDGRIIAHVEFAAPLETGCDAFRLASWAWTVERCRDGVCEPIAFRHPTYACPFLAHLPDRRCTDTGRVVVRPRKAGLYAVRLQALRLDGTLLEGSAMVRVGKRPSDAR